MRKFLLITIPLLIISAAIIFLYLNTVKFTSEKWKYVNNPNYYYGHPGREIKREAIYKDLVENYNLKGKSQAEIQQFLGKPDEIIVKNGFLHWKYEISTSYSSDVDRKRISGRMLDVTFKTVNSIIRVSEVQVISWKENEKN